MVIANGLIGYGLETIEAFEALLLGCHATLKSKGLLILGYNDTPERLSFEPEAAASLKLFNSATSLPKQDEAGYYRVEGSNKHTFMFLEKP
ncbi:MAG: hypothetical protein AB7E59_10210 [Pusillimonas sp.]